MNGPALPPRLHLREELPLGCKGSMQGGAAYHPGTARGCTPYRAL